MNPLLKALFENRGSRKASGKKVFPTNHPMVKNEDGSVSNVILSGEDIMNPDGTYSHTVAFPTMVEGKKYEKDEAFEIAKKNGLENYPRFGSVKDMNKWAEKNHGRIDEAGYLKRSLLSGRRPPFK